MLGQNIVCIKVNIFLLETIRKNLLRLVKVYLEVRIQIFDNYRNTSQK